jgi:xanthine permease XanP
MSDFPQQRRRAPSNQLIYQLDDRPGFFPSIFAALQHVLASFVGIITPTLIVGGALGLQSEVPYLISMALFASGIGTFIQARRFGPVGSGLLCLQGTSFAFLSVILSAGFLVKARGGGTDEILGTIFGVCFFAAFVEVAFSQFIDKLRKLISPVVTGTIICLMGLSLIKVAVTDMAGGFGATDLGSAENLGLAFLVLGIIVVLNRFNAPLVRLGAIIIGLTVGYLVAMSLGKVQLPDFAALPLVSVPVPFKYGFAFDWVAFVPIAIIFLVTPLEAAGDLTANSMISHQPVQGPVYIRRIKSGLLADGLNSVIAATLNSMPMVTFAQNNGVIQLTGVASRHVALYIAAIMVLLGLFPVIGAVLLGMPKPVLGGATIIMFGTVAVAGIKILAEAGLHRRNMLIVAISLGLGIGVAVVPEVLLSLPKSLHLIFESSITVGALSAILLNIFLPEDPSAEEEEDYDFDPEAAMTTVRQTIEQAQASTLGLADCSPAGEPASPLHSKAPATS